MSPGVKFSWVAQNGDRKYDNIHMCLFHSPKPKPWAGVWHEEGSMRRETNGQVAVSSGFYDNVTDKEKATGRSKVSSENL